MFIELTVKLKHKPSAGEAKVALFYSNVPGGVKLDRELDGFTSWNFDSLEIVKQDYQRPIMKL